MDGRMGLVIGGMTTVAASVAVVGAVALTNAVALADSAGASVASARVLVPAPTSPANELPSRSAGPATQPEIAEPPTPAVVDAPATPPPAQAVPTAPAAPDTPSAPAAPAAPAPPAPAPVAPQSPEDAVETSREEGWDALRSWALARGWSPERVDAWIAWLQEAHRSQQSRDRDGNGDRRDGDAKAKRSPGSDRTGGAPPQAPADAGWIAERTTGSSQPADDGEKKDRSRESSDRRDR